MPMEREKAYGCLFCITGREKAVAERIERVCPHIRATPAFQEKHKSKDGRKSRIKTVMLPGYVFFEAPDDIEAAGSLPMTDVIRILKGSGEDWQLAGEDEAFARWLFAYDGCLVFSKAYQEGDHIRILSGPLKDMEGYIVRVDRRGRSGQVVMRICQREIRLWLGFELIDVLSTQGNEKLPEGSLS